MDSTETLHDEALRRLCFVCAKLLKQKDRRFKVEDNIEMLSMALDKPVGIVVMDGITPLYFCLNCKLALQKVCSGSEINTSRRVLNWEDCKEDCTTCSYLNTRKKGGDYGLRKINSAIYGIIYIPLASQKQ